MSEPSFIDRWRAEQIARAHAVMEMHTKGADGWCVRCTRVGSPSRWPCGPYLVEHEFASWVERGQPGPR